MSTKQHLEGLPILSLSRQENKRASEVFIFVLFSCLILALCNDVDTSCGDGPVGDADNGIIQSPGYPNPYSTGLSCDWSISLNFSDAVQFTIREFDSNGGDVLAIYDQEPVEAVTPRWFFSGKIDNDTEFISPHNKLWLQFTTQSNQNESLRRFYISYHSYEYFGLSQTCTDPGDLQYGRVHGSDFSVESDLNFTCDEGYELQGDDTIICLLAANGTAYWSNDIPTCSIPCYSADTSRSYYRVPSDVDIILSPNYPEYFAGVKVCAWEINAPEGFGINVTSDTFIFSTRRITMEIWDNSFKDLLDHQLRGNLILNRTNSLEPISTSVSDKTISLIFRSLEASASGRFELTISRFSLNSCHSPPVSNHLMYSPNKTRYSVGNSVHYVCKGTFVIPREDNAPRENTCLPDGTWQTKSPESLPVCVSDCLKWHPLTQTYTPLDIISFPGELYNKGYPGGIPIGICNYTFIAQPTEIITFRFIYANLSNSVELSYEQPGLTMPPMVLDSVTTGDEFRSETNFVNLFVNQTSESLLDQFILGFEITRPSAAECAYPGSPQFGTRTGQNFSIGSTLSFHCFPLFDTIGSNEISCFSVNSTFSIWFPPTPSCHGSCGGELMSDHVTVVSPLYPESYVDTGRKACTWNITNTLDKPFEITLPELNLGSNDNLTIGDQDGFYLVNSLCMSNCSWFRRVSSSRSVTVQFNPATNPQEPTDILMFVVLLRSTVFTMCDSPDSLPNGRTIGNDYSIGSTVHYICVPPYDIEGSLASTCVLSPDGGTPVWDNEPPVCIIQDCTPPSRPMVRDAGTGAIASPGYPGQLLRGSQECQWVIVARGDNQIIALNFRYLDLPDSSHEDQQQPSVLVFETGDNRNNLLANFTVSVSAYNVISVTNRIRVEYHGPIRNSDGYRGIYIEYNAIPASSSSTAKTANPQTTTTAVVPPRSSKPTTKEISIKTSTREPSTSATTTTLSPTTTTPSKQSTDERRGTGSTRDNSNAGGIVAGILVPLIILSLISIAIYIWYRQRYPVRMVLGRDFGKFSNPIYEKGASTLTLVKEDIPVLTPTN